MENRCLICGRIVPEGTEVCPLCLKKWLPDEDDDPEKLQSIKKANEQKKKGDERIVIH